MPRGQTINSDPYTESPKATKHHFRSIQPHTQKPAEILLQHNKAWPLNLKIQEAITQPTWTILPHPPYSLDLANLMTSLEPWEKPSLGRGSTMMMRRLLKKWTRGWKHKILMGTRWEYMPLFLAGAQGCWSQRRLYADKVCNTHLYVLFWYDHVQIIIQ
jgi:hypothetical protein